MSKTRTGSPEKIDWMDIESLAAVLAGKCEDDEREVIEEAFQDKFDLTLEHFENLITALWPLLDFGISPLTDTPFIGFANKKETVWIVKRDITSQFINGVIKWLGDQEIKPGAKGMQREITNKGKIEYKITITKPENK